MSRPALWRSAITLLFVAVLIPPGLWLSHRIQMARDVAYFQSLKNEGVRITTRSEIETSVLQSWLPDAVEPWALPLFEIPVTLSVRLDLTNFTAHAPPPVDLQRIGGLTTLRELTLADTSIETWDPPTSEISPQEPPLSYEVDPKFLRLLPGLKKLSIYDLQLKKVVFPFIAKLSQLEELDLNRTGVTDSDLAILGEMTHLTHLSLAGNSISDEGATSLRGLVSLEFLNLSDTNVTRQSILRLAGLQHLKVLWLPDELQLIDDDLAIMSRLPLVALKINSPFVTALGFRHVAQMLTLERLEMNNTTVSADDLAPLAELKSLTALTLPPDLRLSGCLKYFSAAKLDRFNVPSVIFTDEDVPYLIAMNSGSGAFHLNLSESQVTDNGIAALERASTIVGNDLSKTRVTDAGLPPLTTIPKLEGLNLSGTKITDKALESIARFTTLQRLDLSETSITDAELSRLAGLNLLYQIDLGKTSITDAGLPALFSLDSLSDLDLEETRISDAGMEIITGLPSLSALNLSRTSVTAKGLAGLSKLKNLSHLDLNDLPVDDAALAEIARCTKLFDLNLSGTAITDLGLEQLLNCKSLYMLDLRRTRITDAGLLKLAGLTNLEYVKVYDTSVTSAGLGNFERRQVELHK